MDSNVDQIDDEDNRDGPETDPADLVLGEQNEAKSNAFSGLDEDPARATRAKQLGDATGINPALVMNDLENFDKQNKAAMTSKLLNDNQYLQRYLVKDPIAAAISNDDYSQLDEVSQKVLEFDKHTSAPKEFVRSAAASAVPAIGSLPAMAAGATYGAELGAVGGPWGALAGGIIGGAGAGLGAGYALQSAQDWLLSKLPEGIPKALGLDPESRVLGEKTHPTASFLGGLAPFAATLKPTGAGLAQRAVSGLAMGGFEAGQEAAGPKPISWENVALATLFGGVFAEPNKIGQPLHDVGVRAAESFAAKVSPYWRNGEEPPAGIDPNIDAIKLQENETGVNALDQALQAAQTSSTRERSPDTMADFVRMHTESSIGIEPDAIKALYGENIPHSEDGLLGWVPNLANELILADLSGSDVRVPVADWLAKVDPQVATQLRDNIRIRPEGMTKAEGERPMPEQSDLPPDDVFDLVRESAGLGPLLGAPRRSLSMVETEASQAGIWAPGSPVHQQFALQDPAGKQVGQLEIATADGGKTLLVENIYSEEVGSFGPSTVRDLLRQVRERFPQVEKIEGFRVSGARDKAGATGVASLDLTKPPKPEDFDLVADNMNRKPYDSIVPDNAKVGGKPVKIGDYAVLPEYSFPVKDAIEHIDISQLRDIPKALATFFGNKLKDAVGDVDVSIVSDYDLDTMLAATDDHHLSGAPAMYSVGLNRIFVSSSAIESAFYKPRMQQIVYEEAAHAFTVRAMEADKAMLKNVNLLMEEFKEHVAEADPSILSDLSYYLDDPYEFVAAGWSHPRIQEAMASAPISNELALRLGLKQPGVLRRALGRQLNIWDAMKELVKSLLEKVIGVRPDDTILDGLFNISRKIEENRAAVETSPNPRQVLAAEPPIDEAAAIGLTKPQYAKYQELIAKQEADMAKAKISKAYDQQERRLGREWKEKEAEERPAAVEAVNARPDVSADNFIRFGEFFGQKVDGPTKMRADLVPEELRKGLPRDYFSKEGMSPDDYASLFGYPNGKAMLLHLAEWNAKVKASGLRPYEYKRLMVNQELQSRMEEKYGNFDKEVMQAAQDQVTSETQLNILHEETIGLAHKAGEQFPLTQQALKDAAKDNFQNLQADGLTVNRFLQTAGKAGREAEMALLKGDPATAFRAKQQQYFAMIYAREAKGLEKAQADFAKTMKKFSSREVKGTNQEFTNFIHQLMLGAGEKVKRSASDIAESIVGDGNTTLEAFVGKNQADGWELDVSPELFDGKPKPVKQMTVAEFTEFKDAVDSLAYVGREVNKIEIAGQKAEFDEFRREVVAKITELPIRTPEQQRGGLEKLKSLLWGWDAVLTRVEEMVKDLEGHEELGPLYRATILPMMEGKHKKYQLEEDLTKKMAAITSHGGDWIKTLDDTIPQDFFKDPYHGGKVLFDMNRANMINIMLNWGNKSNKAKFTRGYTKSKEESKTLEANLQALFDRHATKEDWDFVQHMWDIFKGWKKESGTLYRNLSGIEPKWEPDEPVKTPHGDLAGGYFPIIYDKARSDINIVKEKSPTSSMFQDGYYRATTGNRYTKARTGYAAPIEFYHTLEQTIARMQQQIHDIAYRAPVMQTAKVFEDKQIRAAIRKHYGPEYEAQLRPWVEDIANYANINDKKLSIVNGFLRRVRLGLVVNALGLNVKVMGIHGIGAFNPINNELWKTILNPGPAADLTMAKSKEVSHSFQNMDRDYREEMEQLLRKGQITGIRAKAIKFAFMPMAKISNAYRIATFNIEYKKGLAAGMPEADAIAKADSAIRLRQGSTGIPDLPAIMRGDETMKIATIFYGFFSSMYQWQRQIPGALRRGDWEQAIAAGYGAVLVPALFGATIFNSSNPKDSWFKRMAKAIPLQILQTVPFLREAASYAIEGREARTPFLSLVDSVYKLLADASKVIHGQEPKSPIRDAADAIGTSTTLPLGQLGRSGQFISDVAQRKQRPRNIFDWMHGLVWGRMQEKGNK